MKRVLHRRLSDTSSFPLPEGGGSALLACMKTVAFMNQKGGVGKTTTTVSVGAVLANEHHRKVLLVDLDPQGNMSDHVGIDPGTTERSVYDVIIDGLRPEEVVHSVHALDILPANLDLSGAEIELAGMMMRETRLKNALSSFCSGYDDILVDCPPSLGLLTISALTLAQEVVVPMEAEYLALRGLSQLVQTIDLVKQHLNPSLEVSGVVFCKFDGRTNLAKDVKAEVEKHFPGKVYTTAVRKNVRLAEAPSYGKPITLYDANCAGSVDYRRVTEEFLARAGELAPSRREPVWRGDDMDNTTPDGKEFSSSSDSGKTPSVPARESHA